MKKSKLIYISISVILLLCAVFFVCKALNNNISYFLTPSQLKQNYKNLNLKKRIRIGGLVKVNSLKQIDDKTISFVITDNKNETTVNYSGILPDLFAQGKGVISEGFLLKKNGLLMADMVLAKHDEQYSPPNKKQE